ncbi:MAG: hypothetical protein NTV05_06270 [Acidobacteria bacterium]|nr:hypothetical protein [Acidobacteriota bacterium]
MPWLAVVRDVVIIYALTFLGGFVVGVAGGQGPRGAVAIGLSNVLFGIVGFTISGCLARVKRWRHLTAVATVVWLASGANIFFGAGTVLTWILGIMPTGVVMAIGGGLSHLFVRRFARPETLADAARSEP